MSQSELSQQPLVKRVWAALGAVSIRTKGLGIADLPRQAESKHPSHAPIQGVPAGDVTGQAI